MTEMQKKDFGCFYELPVSNFFRLDSISMGKSVPVNFYWK